MSITLTWLNRGIDDRELQYLNNETPFNLRVRLYVNSHSPVVTDTDSAFTECTATGYASQTLIAANWSGSTSGGVATYTYPTLTFTFTAGLGQTVYGVYLDDAATPTPHTQMAGLLDVPFAIPSGGGTLTIALTDQFHQC